MDDGSWNRQTVRKQVPHHARAHAAIVTHSCYSLHLCDDISDKKEMLIALRSTLTDIFESGLSSTFVHLHLSHIIPRKSTIYDIFYHDPYLPKDNLGKEFFRELVNVTFWEESV